jgi:hypothetical protein
MKKIILALALITATTSAYAAELVVGSRPGGAGNYTFAAVQPTLKQHGYTNNIQFLGDCRKGKARHESGPTNDMYWVNNAYHSIPGCGVEITKANLVDAVAKSSTSICYRSDKAGLGLDDLMYGNKDRSIAVPNMWESFANALMNEFKTTAKRTVINVGNSKGVAKTLLGNDIDYIIHYSKWAAVNLDKVTCVINTGDTASLESFPGTKTMAEVAPNFAIKTFYDVWFIVTNPKSDADLQNMRKWFKKARSQKHFSNNFKAKALEVIDVSFSDALKIANKAVGDIKMFEKNKTK